MSKSIYLITPKPDFADYYSAEVYTHLGLTPVAYMADLAVTTVAAMAPDEFEVVVCDERITPADLDCEADFVGLTGNSGQVGRMLELAQSFRQRGKTVIIGGPYASLVPEVVRPHCDILVRGEIETIASQLFADLGAGTWQAEYVVQGWPDLRGSPVPRWDLYPNDRALIGCVQTSRGCPFECEFCDVIQYAGKQRHKSIEQVLAELDELYQYGYCHVFLADDNFTAHRGRAKELLMALRDWNDRQPEGRLTFSTQLSIDAARDDELLRLCHEAGIYYVLIGLETPNEESLREVKKRQNVGLDLGKQIQRFLDYGIAVTGGMMVGFDSDGLDIFKRQDQFAMATPIPIFILVALIASHSTPFYTRLQQHNRLSPDKIFRGYRPWYTNIVPKQMTREQLLAGMRWLSNRLYHPLAFGRRVLHFIESYQEPPLNVNLYRMPSRQIDQEMMEAVQNVCRLGAEETRMFLEIAAAVAKKSVTQRLITLIMFQYSQIRYMFQTARFWEPHLAEQSTAKFLE